VNYVCIADKRRECKFVAVKETEAGKGAVWLLADSCTRNRLDVFEVLNKGSTDKCFARNCGQQCGHK
jgi:hypothetical protein